MHMVEKILNNTTPYGKIRASHEGSLHSSTLNSRNTDWSHILITKKMSSQCNFIKLNSMHGRYYIFRLHCSKYLCRLLRTLTWNFCYKQQTMIFILYYWCGFCYASFRIKDFVYGYIWQLIFRFPQPPHKEYIWGETP